MTFRNKVILKKLNNSCKPGISGKFFSDDDKIAGWKPNIGLTKRSTSGWVWMRRSESGLPNWHHTNCPLDSFAHVIKPKERMEEKNCISVHSLNEHLHIYSFCESICFGICELEVKHECKYRSGSFSSSKRTASDTNPCAKYREKNILSNNTTFTLYELTILVYFH